VWRVFTGKKENLAIDLASIVGYPTLRSLSREKMAISHKKYKQIPRQPA